MESIQKEGAGSGTEEPVFDLITEDKEHRRLDRKGREDASNDAFRAVIR
jgi:hypothetical protein